MHRNNGAEEHVRFVIANVVHREEFRNCDGVSNELQDTIEKLEKEAGGGANNIWRNFRATFIWFGPRTLPGAAPPKIKNRASASNLGQIYRVGPRTLPGAAPHRK